MTSRKYSATEVYKHLAEGRLWVRCLGGWECIVPLQKLRPREIPLTDWPIQYLADNKKVIGKIFYTSYVMTTDEKYWQLADAVIHEGDLNGIRCKSETPG